MNSIFKGHYWLGALCASFFSLLIVPLSARAAGEFIIQVDTTKSGVTSDHAFQIPTENGYTYNYNVDWGDGNTTTGTSTSATHTYVASGLHTIKITGTFPSIKFNFGGDKDKLVAITQWGTNPWQAMNSAFAGCSNLTITATDAPNLSGIIDLIYAFRATGLTTESLNNWDVSTIQYFLGTFQDTQFNGDISSWDTSAAVNMSAMFYGDHAFNQDIHGWDVSNVTTMNSMFAYDTAFNNAGQPMSWDVRTYHVTDMASMFYHASSFNQNISDWNVSSVTNMNSMFEGASSFNNGDATNATQSPLKWNQNTWQVTNMQGMFAGATHFNQFIGAWNTAQVTTMAHMFDGAELFDQDLSDWDLTSVGSLEGMFTLTALSTKNYEAVLRSWSMQSLQSGLTLGADEAMYCDSSFRDALIGAPNNWTILDGGNSCPGSPTVSFSGSTPDDDASFTGTTTIPTELTTSAVGNNYAFIDFDHSLLGWWRFHDSNSDDSGSGAHGTWNGTMSFKSGRFGNAAHFDGATSFDAQLGHDITSSFTVSAWVYLDSLTIGAGVISDTNEHLLQIGGSYRWQFDDTYSASSVADVNTWTHLAGVYDASTGVETLYVNGTAVSSTTSTRTVTKNLSIGKRTDNTYLTGRVDDVLIFGRALGTDEIASLYNGATASYNHTFTDLTLGEHQLKAYLADAYGSVGATSQKTVSLLAAPVPASPTSGTGVNPAASVGGGASVSTQDLARILAPSAAATAYLKSRGLQTAGGAIQNSPTPMATFSRSLKSGTNGEDVRNLQKFLNAHGFTVSNTGAGSPGHETSTFAYKTKQAVIRFQEANAARILAPNGLSHGTGIFGPSSIQFAQEMIRTSPR